MAVRVIGGAAQGPGTGTAARALSPPANMAQIQAGKQKAMMAQQRPGVGTGGAVGAAPVRPPMPVRPAGVPPTGPTAAAMQAKNMAMARQDKMTGAGTGGAAGPAIAGASRTLGFKKGGVVPPFPKPPKAGTKVAGKKTVVKTGKGGKPPVKGKANPFAKGNPFANKGKGKSKTKPFKKFS